MKSIDRGLRLFVTVFLILAFMTACAGPSNQGQIVAKQLTVQNATDLQGTVSVDGAATLDSTLNVTGATTVTGATALNGGLTMDTNKFTVADTSGNTAIGGTLAVTGNTTVAGTFAANGATLAANKFVSPNTTLVTVTDGSTITPTATFQGLTAAGNVGTSSIAAGASGQFLTLMNTSNTTITITDTTGMVLAGNAALAQWDTLSLVYYGTAWYQVSKSDN